MKFALTFPLITCLLALAAGFPSSSQELQPGIPTLFEEELKRQAFQVEQSLIPLTRAKRENEVHFVNDAGQRQYRECRTCGNGGYREYTSSVPVSTAPVQRVVTECRGGGCNNGGYREYTSSVPVSTAPVQRVVTECRGGGCDNVGYRQYVAPVSSGPIYPVVTGCRGGGCNGGYREYTSVVPVSTGPVQRVVTGCRGSGCNNGGYTINRQYTPVCRGCTGGYYR